MAIGACGTLVDDVALDGSVQRVVGRDGSTADVGDESEFIHERWGSVDGGGVEGYASCGISVDEGEPFSGEE